MRGLVNASGQAWKAGLGGDLWALRQQPQHLALPLGEHPDPLRYLAQWWLERGGKAFDRSAVRTHLSSSMHLLPGCNH